MYLTTQSKTGKSNYIAFGSDEGIQILICHGHLTLMDSTHNTNKLGWYLTTLMLRDEHYTWIPVAYLLHDK
jgi:hypothetical protein